MRFRLLGPLEVQPQAPSAGKQRAVLARLLVDAGHLVSTDTLIEEVWGAAPPRTARGTLQVYVSQLRKLLAAGGPETVVSRTSGYRLDTDPDQLDLHRFQRLSAAGERRYAAGDHEGAARELRQALALWRGPALSDVPQGTTLRAAADHLDLLHLSALEQRISADLWLGRHRQVIPELSALVRAHPLRESLHGHLIVALYRSQQTSEALARYAAVRARLAEELGTDPGPGLRELHLRMLRSAEVLHMEQCLAPLPASRGSAAVPAARPAPVVHLPRRVRPHTGRDAELAKAEAVLRGGPAPVTVVVTGGPCAGKATFAAELAHRTADVFPDGRVLICLSRGPLGTAEVLLRVLSMFDPEQAASYPRGSGPDGPDGSDDVLDTEELTDRLRALFHRRRVLLVLADVRHEAQVRALAMTDATLLLTTRNAALALGSAHHVPLGPLSPEDSLALLAHTAGALVRQDPDTAAAVAALCEHLPAALRAAAAWLNAHPSWPARALLTRMRDPATRLDALSLGDHDIRARLLAAADDVPPHARRALRLLALAPAAGFAPWCADALLDAPATDAVEALCHARLLESHPLADEPVRLRMNGLTHALATELAAQRDAAGRDETRAALQRLSAACTAHARQALRHLAPGWRPAHLPDLAPAASGPAGAPAALRWFLREQESLLDVARKAYDAGLWEWVGALTESLTAFCEAGALWEPWDRACALALDAARRGGDPRAEAVALCAHGALALQLHQPDVAAARFDLAHRRARQAAHRHSEMLALTGLADTEYGWGHISPARHLYTRALALSRAEDHPHGTCDALRGLALVDLADGDVEAALRRVAACAETARAAGDRRWAGYAERITAWLRPCDGLPDDTAIEIRPGIWHLRRDPPPLPRP